jgi:hypothetical protein
MPRTFSRALDPGRELSAELNMADSFIDRRVFLGGTMAMLAALPSAASADRQAPEARGYFFDLPPKSKLWGVVTFLSEQMVEVTVKSKERSQSERGRFDGKRLAELSWTNGSADAERIHVSARLLDGNRELPGGSVKFAAEQHLFVGFGERPKPVEQSARHGGYPHDAVFVGFIVFGD